MTQKGGTLHRSQVFRVFQAIAESVGFPADKRHPHVLKHSLASHLSRQRESGTGETGARIPRYQLDDDLLWHVERAGFRSRSGRDDGDVLR